MCVNASLMGLRALQLAESLKETAIESHSYSNTLKNLTPVSFSDSILDEHRVVLVAACSKKKRESGSVSLPPGMRVKFPGLVGKR